MSEYGVSWDKTADTYARLGDAFGNAPSAFNNFYPWCCMKRVCIDDSGNITSEYGDGYFKEDGSVGQVMVKIPKFYYKTVVTANGYEWWVSDNPLAGYKLHPTFVRDQIECNEVFIGAYEATAFDVTAEATEINTITVTHAATADGVLTIVLDGNNTFVVAVTAGDTADQVAAKIRAATYIGYQQSWTTGGAGPAVTFTCSKSGLKTTATIAVAATGVTATVAKSVSGAGGYMLNDPTGVDTTATTGDKLSSVSGVKPATGWNGTKNITTFRTLAGNRGAGWGQEDFLTASAVQLLYLIEYAHFNSQAQIGAGVTTVTDDGVTNMAVYTGQTSALGNSSGSATGQTHYQTAQAANSVSYRGIENFWGNLWTFVDGLNVKADRNPWVADHDFASDKFEHPYVDSGLTLGATNGYAVDIALDTDNDYQFLPSSVTGGSATTKLCDNYYQATGNRIALRGAPWSFGVFAGAFCWYLLGGSSASNRNYGARLAFVDARRTQRSISTRMGVISKVLDARTEMNNFIIER